jgi:signal transduction histidine kinase
MQAEAKGLRFDVHVSPDAPVLETDPERLRQLLQAVVSNAIKFTARGSVAVSASRLPIGGEDGVELSVTDTGPGIPGNDVQLIFGPFEQLGDPARHDTMKRGVGMGLTIARQIAQRLGGTLEADPESPTGATFHLRLPAVFRRG